MRLQPEPGRRSQGAPAADHPGASGGGFRGRVRSRALCAVRRSVRRHALPLRARSICGRPRRTPRSSLNDLAGTPADRLLEAQRQRARSRLAASCRRRKASPRSRRCRWTRSSVSSPGASPPCLKPQLAIEDRADPVIEAAGRRLAIPFADYWRPTAANYWGRVKKAHGLAIGREILGERWARDHADDKKPVLAAALETAFDPAEEHRLHRSRPGGARHRRGVAAARHGLWRRRCADDCANAGRERHRASADVDDAAKRRDAEHRVNRPAGLPHRRRARRRRAQRRSAP